VTLAVRIAGVVKRFGNHTAVDDLSFEVPTGVIYGVLGPNGAGKSTTLRMMNDIIAPDAGTIELFGALPPGGAAAQRIGFLPEERGLYPKMPVGEMIAFFGELRGLTAADARGRARAWLERLGLGQWEKNKVQDLSKGMQQKVQFASALIHEPELVILDEPWSGLDPINADVLREVVHELRDAGKTVLFSTHQMEQAEICEQTASSPAGKVLDGGWRRSRAAAGGRVVLGFRDEAAAVAAAPVLADAALVLPPPVDHALDREVQLAAGVEAQRLLLALVGAGVALRRFDVVTPSLHDIFVERVGREQAEVAARHDAVR
jgi:ABC-2 type transport system ATP-binding protein